MPRLRECRSFELFPKVLSIRCGAALNTEKACSAAHAVCLRAFGLMAHIDARPHLLRLRARTGAHSGGIGCEEWRTEGYADDVREGRWVWGGGVGGRSGPHAYKVRSGRGGSSQPSGQVKGAHQLQVRGARTQTSCHASVRPPAVPAGAPRALLRLLHPELPPGRETSAAGERHQTGGETRSAFFYSDIMPTSH